MVHWRSGEIYNIIPEPVVGLEDALVREPQSHSLIKQLHQLEGEVEYQDEAEVANGLCVLVADLLVEF